MNYQILGTKYNLLAYYICLQFDSTLNVFLFYIRNQPRLLPKASTCSNVFPHFAIDMITVRLLIKKRHVDSVKTNQIRVHPRTPRDR